MPSNTCKRGKHEIQESHSDICIINSACTFRWGWVKPGCLLSLTASQDTDDAATSSIAHPAIIVKQLQIRRRCTPASAVQISISHAGMLLDPPYRKHHALPLHSSTAHTVASEMRAVYKKEVIVQFNLFACWVMCAFCWRYSNFY